MSKQSHLNQQSLVLFDPQIESYQMLGAMAMKEYAIFPKASALLEHHHQII